MGQPYPSQYKTRTAVVLFLKNAVAPIILYLENPKAEYEELLGYIKNSSHTPKLIEKETTGPIKKIAVFSNQIAAVAIQEEQFN